MKRPPTGRRCGCARCSAGGRPHDVRSELGGWCDEGVAGASESGGAGAATAFVSAAADRAVGLHRRGATGRAVVVAVWRGADDLRRHAHRRPHAGADGCASLSTRWRACSSSPTGSTTQTMTVSIGCSSTDIWARSMSGSRATSSSYWLLSHRSFTLSPQISRPGRRTRWCSGRWTCRASAGGQRARSSCTPSCVRSARGNMSCSTGRLRCWTTRRGRCVKRSRPCRARIPGEAVGDDRRSRRRRDDAVTQGDDDTSRQLRRPWSCDLCEASSDVSPGDGAVAGGPRVCQRTATAAFPGAKVGDEADAVPGVDARGARRAALGALTSR